MAQKRDIPPLEQVEALLAELSEAKFRRADAYTDVRPSEKSVDDARHRVTVLMRAGHERYRARDVEVIRVELAIAMKKLGIDYPQPDS